jgi:hypothetical protein
MSVSKGVSAKRVDDKNEMHDCPENHGIYHARLEGGRTLLVLAGEDTDYTGYIKK